MAEDLTDYLADAGIKVQYLHSDIDTITRIEILRSLRLGAIDVLVGINLLREGLDLPEVSLVAILDADKEGFLRSASSLIQTMGRAARNVDGRVVLYADTITDSMRTAVSVTQRRRERQIAYNAANGIDPKTITKAVTDILARLRGSGEGTSGAKRSRADVRSGRGTGHCASGPASPRHPARSRPPRSPPSSSRSKPRWRRRQTSCATRRRPCCATNSSSCGPGRPPRRCWPLGWWRPRTWLQARSGPAGTRFGCHCAPVSSNGV